MLRILSLIIVVLTCVSFDYAQRTAAAPKPPIERPRSIVALLNDARLAAPELAVDTILRVVESKKVTDATWRKELLEEALRITADVKYPVRREVVRFPNTPVDTVAGYMSYAYDQKLDALSLKARVIKDLLRDDKDRARQIVFEIGGDLPLKPLTCEDTLAYDVTDIYKTVREVAKAAFTSKEISDGIRATYLSSWVNDIRSPAQIGPASEMLKDLQGPANERQMLFTTLSRSTNRSFGDDRSFAHALRKDLLQYAVLASGVSMNDHLFLGPTLREVIDKNTKGVPRCLDHKPAKPDELPEDVDYVKAFFELYGQPVAPSDYENVEYKGSPDIKLHWRSETSQKIDHVFRSARDIKNEADKKNDKDAQLEWELKVNSILDELDSWKASDNEPEREVFNQKCIIYRAMSGEVDGPIKKAVLRAFLRYLAASPIQRDSFIEWLYHARWIANNNASLFLGLTDEFPNPNLKVMIASQLVLGDPGKAGPPQPSADKAIQQTPTPKP